MVRHDIDMETGLPIKVFDTFTNPAETAAIRAQLEQVPREGGPLIPAPQSVFAFLAARLSGLEKSKWAACAPLLSFHDTSAGMHQHRDEPYMGGDMTLLLYLTTPSHGGHTCVGGERVAPVAGRAVLFGISDLHHGEPVSGDVRKVVLAVEMRRV